MAIQIIFLPPSLTSYQASCQPAAKKRPEEGLTLMGRTAQICTSCDRDEKYTPSLVIAPLP